MLTSFNWSWGSKLFWQRYVTDSLISERLVPTPPNHSMTTVSNCFGHPGLHFSGLLWKCPGFACQRLLVGWQIVFEMCVCNCFWCFWSRVMSEVSSVGDQCLSDRSSRVLDQPWRQKGLEQKRDRSVEAGERKPRSSRCIIRRRISSKSILARRISISLHCKGDIHVVFVKRTTIIFICFTTWADYVRASIHHLYKDVQALHAWGPRCQNPPSKEKYVPVFSYQTSEIFEWLLSLKLWHLIWEQGMEMDLAECK